MAPHQDHQRLLPRRLGESLLGQEALRPGNPGAGAIRAQGTRTHLRAGDKHTHTHARAQFDLGTRAPGTRARVYANTHTHTHTHTHRSTSHPGSSFLRQTPPPTFRRGDVCVRARARAWVYA